MAYGDKKACGGLAGIKKKNDYTTMPSKPGPHANQKPLGGEPVDTKIPAHTVISKSTSAKQKL